MALRFIAIDPGTDQGHCPADPHALHPSAGGCYAGDSRTSCAPSEAEPQERALWCHPSRLLVSSKIAGK